jgi:hypothetical protein
MSIQERSAEGTPVVTTGETASEPQGALEVERPFNIPPEIIALHDAILASPSVRDPWADRVRRMHAGLVVTCTICRGRES